MPANDLKGLIGWLRDNPGKASAGTTGPGGVGHVVGVFFQQQTKTQFEFVPYRGLAPAMQDMIAGQIDIMFDTAANSVPQVRAGNVRGFAVTAKARLPAAPDLPTVDEAGLPGFCMSNWRGLWAPKGTPADIVAKLNGAVRAALADATVRKRLAELGARASAAGAAHAGGARHPATGGDRAVVAHHPRCQHQGHSQIADVASDRAAGFTCAFTS